MTEEDKTLYLKDFMDKLVSVKLYSVGEVLDAIEVGMLAVSIRGEDEGLCIAADVKGRLFCFGIGDDPHKDDDTMDISYGFAFRMTGNSPHRRYLLIKNADEYYDFQSVNDAD